MHSNFYRFAAVIAAAGLLASCAPPAPPPPTDAQLEAAAAAITIDDMREMIIEMSDDRYKGRAPGSEGDKMATDYISQRLEAIGAQPSGDDGTWLQKFELVGLNAQQPDSWSFTTPNGEKSYTVLEDYVISSGRQEDSVGVEDAELVFVGFGIQAPEYDWDDFKGADLKGKVLVVLNNDPDWDPELFEGNRRLYYGRWSYKYESAARAGAIGAIIIHTRPSAGYGWEVVRNSWSGMQFELPDDGSAPLMQIEAWVTEPVARDLIQAAGQDLDTLVELAKSRDFSPVPLGVTTTLSMPVEMERTASANVLGVLPGTDKADEYVVLTAHHDHMGENDAAGDEDGIYNGARDNASGTAGVIAVAKALAELQPAPRRSILIALVGAEEQGLLGSKFLAAYPPVPAGKLAALLNVDAPNVYGPTADIAQVGKGKSGDLDRAVESAAQRQGRTEVKGDTEPTQGLYYRSDHFSLAKVGVPGIYLKMGEDFNGSDAEAEKARAKEYNAKHYHQPSDEYDPKWNLEGLRLDMQLVFYAGVELANMEALPAWNPGDEFEAARMEAIEAAK
ncbi:MAG: M28 family peptidase [Gammaproteobacteria bacterium AqS3]|nr:M28 family peptidase [Gammaproteobacteria bacterium AqS3]